MELIPDKRRLVGLIEQARDGKICLPEFQRDFVWRRDEVADLLRSILRRYYIGSLLLLRCDPQAPPFAPAAFRGAKPTYREVRPEMLVLDGQQRLTSLLYALTAPDLRLKDSSQRRWFFLDLKLLLDDPDDDEIAPSANSTGLIRQAFSMHAGSYPAGTCSPHRTSCHGVTALTIGCESTSRITIACSGSDGGMRGPRR